ncbi:MAG: glucosyl-3-phosphoglycerate synthase [Actinomycetales bacterium]|nr:glucosyl-3-phosphoglycerate synthase [Actinomycetales bacterium]
MLQTVPTAHPPLDLLLERKGRRTITVCLPARNEDATIGPLVQQVRGHLLDELGLVDELVVMDHDSTDDTAGIASAEGATVVAAGAMLDEFGPVLGKGDVLWRSLEATSGDIIVWLDADLGSFDTTYVTRLVAPLLLSTDIALVKGTYQRALHGDATGGGRVTELAAKPALRLLHPRLAHIRQPLAGEYAIRRDIAESVPFEVDYGVEVGLLIDIAALAGVESIAQTDLGTRIHRNRDLDLLGLQAEQVLRAILARSGHPVGEQVTRPPLAALRRVRGTTSRAS